MSDYFKLRLSAVYSSNSDYSDPSIAPKFDDFTSSTVTKSLHTTVSAATTGTTVECGNFSAIECVIIKNKDVTNYVDASFTAASTASKSRTVAGGFTVLSGPITVASDLVLTANTAACICEVIIVGT